jgi:hypothetical protein
VSSLFDACSRLMLRTTQLPQPFIARVHGMTTAVEPGAGR